MLLPRRVATQPRSSAVAWPRGKATSSPAATDCTSWKRTNTIGRSALTPTVAVVTNIEADHLDIYADLADIKGAFAQFVRGARHIVLCADDRGANSLPTPSATEVVRYGFDNADARLVARGLDSRDGGSAFDVVFDDEMLGRVTLAIPGRHNVLNALAAIGSGLALGADFAAMARGLAAFAGAERRFQRLGEIGGVCVVDDYAHHPTEIAATLSAARAAYPDRRSSRHFSPSLFQNSRFCTGIRRVACRGGFGVPHRDLCGPQQPVEGVTSTLIVDALTAAGGALAWRGDRSALADALQAGVRDGDLVLTIGAGDITKTGPELLERLGRKA
jgi:UDP-N-acetylmuramate--alanine ligase